MRGVVVAPQPVAAEVGAKVLQQGGNAVDAAVTCAFMQMVADPMMGGIGGHGMINIFLRESNERSMITFPTQVPSAATESLYEPEEKESRGGLYRAKNNENQIGYKAVGIPGTLKGLHEALNRYGTVSWKEAIMPAAEHAGQGIQVHEDFFHFLSKEPRFGEVDHRTRLNATAECARIYLDNGEFYRPGDILVLTDYAKTLERIATQGLDVFTKGEIAETIEADFRKNGGILTKADLEEYQPEITQPVKGTYRNLTYYTAPYPGAGILQIFMLNILEGFDLENMSPDSPEYLHLLARTQDVVFAEREKVWGDPKMADIPLDELTSKDFAAECREKIKKGEVRFADQSTRPEDTTHVSVTDADGNAVSLTHSLGVSSGVVVPGLGFIFNNGMHRFNPKPGGPNSVAPGKRRPASNTPTIVFKDSDPVMVLGASGGFGIITGVLQTMLNFIDHKMSILEAVSAPRVHSENNLINVENRIGEGICQQLRAKGHRVQKRPFSYDRSFGNVQAIVLDWERDSVVGASCPRRGGLPFYT